MSLLNESIVEEATLDWFEELGYQTLHGPAIAPDEPGAERTSYADVVLTDRLRSTLARLNPGVPAEILEEAALKITRTESPGLVENNRSFHRMLAEGVDVEYRAEDGHIVYDKVRLVDFSYPDNNDWLALNQFTVIEGDHHRRPDVVVFVNGLPLGLMELKNPTDENATLRGAYNQLQTYKNDIPSLFPYNEVLVISDGVGAKVGTLTSSWEWFLPWRTVEGEDSAPESIPELEVVTKGVFEKGRFLDLIRHFVVFEQAPGGTVKKMAAYHQFHAVNKAVVSTVEAASPEGDRRVGVVWHTQGSGKSLSMAFYAGKVVLHPAMANPTLVVLTDRNDLDDQLFGTFAASATDLLRQSPQQTESREHLRELLSVAAGGVVFTTIQKFLPGGPGERYPLLSDRRNIVFIADEAHRSQYDFIDGFARHMRDALPNASFIGFTGTPIEVHDRSTPAVFGEYIDIYDIQQAVEDGATVPVYYEARVAELELNEAELPKVDPEFEEVTEGEEVESKEKLKTKWARLEALVGAEKRVARVAQDIVEHFEERLNAMDGKAMIVGMSRRICVDLYNAITDIRPEWHDEGAIKVVMTGSASDPPEWQQHIRNKARREALARRLKDPEDPLKIVIVRDMWLTGFDAPVLHTMYVDKPMRGHGLMQAIARVNRVYKDKPGGLVVDYLGIAEHLKQALSSYTERDRDQTGIPQETAVAVMLEKYEIAAAMLYGFDYSAYTMDGAPAARLRAIPGAMEHILSQDPENGKKRFLQAVTELSKAFALAVPAAKALAIRDDVGFFQAVRAVFAKTTTTGRTTEDLDLVVGQLVSRSISSAEVLDIFAAAGLQKPDISILSDEFLEEVRGVPQKNLAVEMLEKLLNDQIKARSRRNVVEARSFAALLERAVNQYRNRSLETAEVIQELVELARQMRAAHRRGDDLGLAEDELAFYDALETNDSTVAVLGDDKLKIIARELVETVRRNATVDWTLREDTRANMRRMVKRILRKHGYPPDKQQAATQTLLEQAESLAA